MHYPQIASSPQVVEQVISSYSEGGNNVQECAGGRNTVRVPVTLGGEV